MYTGPEKRTELTLTRHCEYPSPVGQTSPKNFAPTSPLPPCGHPLPVPGARGKMKEVLWEKRSDEAIDPVALWMLARVAGFLHYVRNDGYLARCTKYGRSR